MSLEVFGDEGLPALTWDETAMRQEFDVIRNRFNKWIVDFKKEATSPELASMIEIAETTMDKLANSMEGAL